MFETYRTLKYLLDKTLTLAFKCNPPSVHPSIHSVHISQVPTAHHCFPKSGKELDERKTGRCPNSSSCGRRTPCGYGLKGCHVSTPTSIDILLKKKL